MTRTCPIRLSRRPRIPCGLRPCPDEGRSPDEIRSRHQIENEPGGNHMSQHVQPRYGVDAYLDWVAQEGIPVIEDYGIDLFKVPTRRGALRRQRRRRSPQGPRRFRQHVPARYSARRLDRSAAPSLRRGDLCARRQRQHAARIQRRPQAQLRVGARSLFAIPLNARYRHFNAGGRERALVVSTTICRW